MDEGVIRGRFPLVGLALPHPSVPQTCGPETASSAMPIILIKLPEHVHLTVRCRKSLSLPSFAPTPNLRRAGLRMRFTWASGVLSLQMGCKERLYVTSSLRRLLWACMLLSLLASLIPPTTAVSVNVTVDDTHGSSDGTVIPVYSPNNASWHLGSPTEQCSVCAIKPSEFDTNQIYDQTWHHATYFVGTPIQVSVTFRGTAVYVYNVIPNSLKGANTNVNLAFTIDGVTVGQFTHTPDSSGTILYNHLVYSTSGLADAEHTLVMSASGSKESLIIFDYLVYTTEDDATSSSAASTSASANPPANTLAPAPSSTTPGTQASTSSPSPSSRSNSNSVSASGSGSPSTALPASAAASTSSSSAALDAASSSQSHTAAIAGGVVGGVVVLLVAPTLVFLLCCRERRKRSSMSAAIDPYTMNSNFDAKADPETDASESESTMPPLVHIGGLTSRPVSASIYSNHATDGGAFPPLPSPVTSARTLETKRELIRGHPHPRSPPRSPGATPLDSDFSLSGSRTGPGGDLSSAGESRVSAGAVQALQEELAVLRGVLSGMTARGGGGAPGHNQPALCESEVLPGYEEARWSSSGNVGTGISDMKSRGSEL